jgi:hypothetical protein
VLQDEITFLIVPAEAAFTPQKSGTESADPETKVRLEKRPTYLSTSCARIHFCTELMR